MNVLLPQSASSGIGNTERGYIQNEVGALISEIDRIANATEYNGVALINATTRLTFQVGIRNVATQSRIRDVDVAEEVSNLSHLQIQMQAGVAVLSQANQMPALVLKLLG